MCQWLCFVIELQNRRLGKESHTFLTTIPSLIPNGLHSIYKDTVNYQQNLVSQGLIGVLDLGSCKDHCVFCANQCSVEFSYPVIQFKPPYLPPFSEFQKASSLKI